VKTLGQLQREMVKEIIVSINWMLFFGGILVGWFANRTIYEVGYQAQGICGECGRLLK